MAVSFIGAENYWPVASHWQPLPHNVVSIIPRHDKKGALDSQVQVIKFTSCFAAHGRWFSSGTPASSTTKNGRHDIAEILFK
jgi:hypothetical protein